MTSAVPANGVNGDTFSNGSKGNLSTSLNSMETATKKKRLRAVVVCTHCRRRKIKCDKHLPCSNCVKVNLSETCAYDPNVDRKEECTGLEILFPVNGRSTPPSIDQGYIGLFAVDSKIKKPKYSSDSAKPVNDSHRVKNEPDVTVRKSELDMLKERLQQIEKSLLGSAPRPLPYQEPNQPPQYPAVQAPAPMSMPTPIVSQMHPPTVAPTPQVLPIGQQRYFQSRMSPPTFGLPLGSFDHHHSVLPPFNAHFKMASDTTNTTPSSLPSMPPNTLDTIIGKADTRNGSTSSSGIPSNISSGLGLSAESNSIFSSTPSSTYLSSEEFMVGFNIVADPNDTINFYEHYSTVHVKDPLRRINSGPFSWSSLLRRDTGLRMVWDYILELLKEKAASKDLSAALVFEHLGTEYTQEKANTILTTKYTDHLEKQFEKRALQTDGIDELIPYNSIIKARKEKELQKAHLNRSTLPLGLTFYDGQIDRELQLIDKIQVVLPKKKVLWKLIDRYFKWMYTYMPFLDEGYFRRDVERIVGPQDYRDVAITEVKIERKLDLATAGILLIVLRLAYLSMFSNNSSLTQQVLDSNDPNPEIQELKYLLSNPININTIDVASLCLDQFQIFRRSNYTVLQLALYIRLYHTYAPEDGDGADGGDSQVLTAVLLQMALSLGLNREPDEQCTDLRINNLSRKIWNYLVMSELHQAYAYGNPMSIDIMYADTKLPLYEPGGENTKDIERDRAITQRFNSCAFMLPDLSEILKMALSVKARVNLSHLCGKLSRLELDWQRQLGGLKEAITVKGCNDMEEIAERNFKVKVYLSIKSFFISIYFHIYLYYEPKNKDLSFFYLKKCLLITTAEIMPHYATLLGKSEVISDMIINPTLEMNIHKANQVNLSALVRVNFVIFHLKSLPDHLQMCKENKIYSTYYLLLCQFSSCLTRATEFTISAISKISNRYYYAWRITKGQTFLLKTLTTPEFYEKNHHKASELYSIVYSHDQLEELIKIIETTLSKFDQSEFCTYGFTHQMDKCLYAGPAYSGPGSVDSTHSDPAEKIGNSEVDKLWLQVLSMKHDNTLAGTYQDHPLDAKTPASMGGPDFDAARRTSYSPFGPPATNGGPPTDVDRFGYEMEMASKFDIYSDMPFDEMFKF